MEPGALSFASRSGNNAAERDVRALRVLRVLWVLRVLRVLRVLYTLWMLDFRCQIHVMALVDMIADSVHLFHLMKRPIFKNYCRIAYITYSKWCLLAKGRMGRLYIFTGYLHFSPESNAHDVVGAKYYS